MNKNKPVLLSIVGIFVLLLSACSWVKLTPGGELVRVATKDDVASCKKVGKTTVSLKAKIAGVKRKSDSVEKELNSLARNSAANMGGNMVVSVSEMENGEKSFEVYQCAAV